MPQVATSSTAVKVPVKGGVDATVVLQNLHASQNAFYGWGSIATDVSSTKSLRLAAGASVTLNLANAPYQKSLWVAANGSDTPTVAYDVF